MEVPSAGGHLDVDYRDYEIAVADVLRFLVGEAATVEPDIRLDGRRSGTKRQIDILVRGRVFGLADALLVVECKQWGKKVDVTDVGAFLSVIEDVGADLGILVTTVGYSKAAYQMAAEARGVSAEVVTFAELQGWHPRGTVSVSLRVPGEWASDAEKTLRKAGFRVKRDPTLETPEREGLVLEAFRLYGSARRDVEDRQTHVDRATAALEEAGIPAETAGTGVTMGGGTPAHRWLEVTDRLGNRLGIKVLASSDDEIDNELRTLAANFNIPRESLSVDLPPEWPYPRGLSSVA